MGASSNDKSEKAQRKRRRRLRWLLKNTTPIGKPDPNIGYAICCRKNDDTAEDLNARGAAEGFGPRDWQEGFCAGCGQVVFVDPETLRLAPNARLCCLECAPLTLAEQAPSTSP